jgi:hypothetical protein
MGEPIADTTTVLLIMPVCIYNTYTHARTHARTHTQKDARVVKEARVVVPAGRSPLKSSPPPAPQLVMPAETKPQVQLCEFVCKCVCVVVCVCVCVCVCVFMCFVCDGF